MNDLCPLCNKNLTISNRGMTCVRNEKYNIHHFRENDYFIECLVEDFWFEVLKYEGISSIYSINMFGEKEYNLIVSLHQYKSIDWILSKGVAFARQYIIFS